MDLLIFFGFLMLVVSVHEFAHGWVAYKLGDTTAKFSGRLTLNPFAHIDPIGTVILPLFLYFTTGLFFASAKPVPINYLALRNPKKDIIWIGLSGPLSNLLLAFLLSVIYKMLPQDAAIQLIFENFIFINIMLGVFNLIPIPPLDGSRIVMGLLPDNLARIYGYIEPFGFILIMLLVWSGMLRLMPLIRFVSHLMGVSI